MMDSFGDYLFGLMIVLYAIATVAYGIEGNIPRLMYFGGSVILSLGVLWMK